MTDSGKYEQLIHMPYKKSVRHPQMPRADRAAQFAPFAALSGYGETIREAQRLTTPKRELSEEEADEMNRRTAWLRAHAKEHPHIRLTYFVADERKEGGSYEVCEGNFLRTDDAKGMYVLTDGRRIRTADIAEVRILNERDKESP